MLDKSYRPDQVEPRIYRLWADSGAFAACAESAAKPWTVMMPPPNVTGSLHMGHALNMTLQDILTRYFRMNGRDALWQPGTDHAGIATQMVVEQQLAEEGGDRRSLGREAFVERVWQWKARSGGTIVRQLRRLGASPDWARERFTLDDGLSRAVRTVFVQLHREGLIYRDKRLVNWDCRLLTAISDLEVVQRETQGHLWYVKYPIEGLENTHITVATTRPETMLGDSGVAVHPDDKRYRDLVDRHAILPLVGRRLPIVADPYSDREKGTGAVKITPAHDFNDFEVGRRHGLRAINILDEHGRIISSPFAEFHWGHRAEDKRGLEHADEDGVLGEPVVRQIPKKYQGLDRFDARQRIVEDLEKQGLIERIEDHVHMVPFGDRSGTVIEPWLTDQWYVDAEALAGPAIEAVERGRTRFVPKNWQSTYFEWMRNIQPWCISRQLWWGHRIPAWYGPDGHIFVAMDEAEARARAEAHYREPVALRQDEDVLDTWFSSALWPFSTLGWPDETPELRRYYPGDVLVTGFDIIFFWVARMMMMGLHFMGEVPFRDVYIHALVRDQEGRKMSKSKGNIIDPVELMDRYGTDALRFTLAAMAAQGRDIKLSEQRVAGYRNFVTKLWNAARFCEMNECRADAEFDLAACAAPVNRWIVGEVAATVGRVGQAIEGYRFNEAADALYHFIWGTFCDWYLEFSKPVLYGDDEAAKAETRAAAGWVFEQTLRALHPLMPFVTEELHAAWGAPRARLLIAERWPALDDIPIDRSARRDMDWVVRVISEVRSVRAAMNVPPSAAIALYHKDASGATRARFAAHGAVIGQLARLSEIAARDSLEPGCAQIVIDETTMFLPLGDVIDLDEERARLTKAIAKLAGETAKLDRKLANQDFLARAPAEVIEAQRARRAEADRSRRKLEEAVARLTAA